MPNLAPKAAEPEAAARVRPASDPRPKSRPRTSRAVHHVSDLTTRPAIAGLVAAAVIISFVVIAITGFDHDFMIVFETACAGITVTMVFVIQHTQRREQMALQLKLDELVRAMPQADDHLIGIEVSSDDELHAHEQRRIDDHVALRERD